MNIRCLTVFAVAALLGGPLERLAAQDLALDSAVDDVGDPLSPIYESVDGVSIGRVFISPGERKRLDAVRHLPQDGLATSPGEPSLSEEAEPVAPKGVGYIQVSGKAPRVFRDGDFVRAPRGEPKVNALPAGVIVRHENETDAREGGEP